MEGTVACENHRETAVMWITGSKRLRAEEYYTACKAPRRKTGVRLRKIKIKCIQGNGKKRKAQIQGIQMPRKSQSKDPEPSCGAH